MQSGLERQGNEWQREKEGGRGGKSHPAGKTVPSPQVSPFCSFCQPPRSSMSFIYHSCIPMAKITRLLCHHLLMKKATSISISTGLTVAGYRNVWSGMRMPEVESPLPGWPTCGFTSLGLSFTICIMELIITPHRVAERMKCFRRVSSAQEVCNKCHLLSWM